MQELTSFISSVGFPIVACCVMFIQQDKLNQSILKLSVTLETIDKRISYSERGKIA